MSGKLVLYLLYLLLLLYLLYFIKTCQKQTGAAVLLVYVQRRVHCPVEDNSASIRQQQPASFRVLL